MSIFAYPCVVQYQPYFVFSWRSNRDLKKTFWNHSLRPNQICTRRSSSCLRLNLPMTIWTPIKTYLHGIKRAFSSLVLARLSHPRWHSGLSGQICLPLFRLSARMLRCGMNRQRRTVRRRTRKARAERKAGNLVTSVDLIRKVARREKKFFIPSPFLPR